MDKLKENNYYKRIILILKIKHHVVVHKNTLSSAIYKKYPGVFTEQFISHWFQKQESYVISKQVHRKFKMASVPVSPSGEQYDVDLTSVGNLSIENDGV